MTSIIKTKTGRRASSPAAAGAQHASATAGSPVERRPLPTRSRWRFLEGLYELRVDPVKSTTRQAEVANLAIASRPSLPNRTKAGRDVISNQSVGLDHWADYGDAADDSSNINIAVLGDLGRGKSALMKILFVLRQLIFGVYVVVIDKKLQGSGGEYRLLAKLFGTTSVRLVPGDGGGSVINLIDPRIGMGGGNRPAGVIELLRAVLAVALDRPLTKQESAAVRVALTAARRRAEAEGRVAVPSDLVWCLYHPDEQDAAAVAGGWSVQRLAAEGETPALALEELLAEDLAGLVDGETSPEVDINHPARLTVFDISQLPETGPALPIMMLLIQTWVSNLAIERVAAGGRTLQIVEEGWHLAEHPVIARLFRKNSKLSRGLALSTVAGFHHPSSDLPADSPARALIREAGWLFIFGQARSEDIEDTLHISGLDPALFETLRQLRRGQCIVVRRGHDPQWIELTRSDLDRVLTNTDLVVTGASETVPLPDRVQRLLEDVVADVHDTDQVNEAEVQDGLVTRR